MASLLTENSIKKKDCCISLLLWTPLFIGAVNYILLISNNPMLHFISIY